MMFSCWITGDAQHSQVQNGEQCVLSCCPPAKAFVMISEHFALSFTESTHGRIVRDIMYKDNIAAINLIPDLKRQRYKS